MTRKVVITGNWKMYKTIPEAIRFVKELTPVAEKVPFSIYLAVPFTAIKSTSDEASGTKIVIGAQNMNDATEGAFTGEIAGKMLKDAGAKFVILGHSERRHFFHETNQLINKKVKSALQEGLQPLVCIGETREQRDQGNTEEALRVQLFESLEGLSEKELAAIILAYEPVWAIGTHHVAPSEIAETSHRFCRELIKEKWGDQAAENIVIQYGGSVREQNVTELMSQQDVDGLLIGGASLSIESFCKIIDNLCSLKENL